MRKPLLLTLLLTAAVSLSARQVSPQQASTAAREFFSSSGNANSAPVKLAPQIDSDADQPFYVFNSEGQNGFVIISGDDRARKVLGYSNTGSIDPRNLPPQLKAMLERFTERISALPESPHSSWTSTPIRTDAQEVLIPTANWGQGYPFNTDCPIMDGEPTLTGCVATAMAIVMKHHGWPENYDWSKMPMNTEEDPIDFEQDSPELARLMHDAGEAVFMEYGPLESGAYIDWIGHRMQYVFNYSPECQYLGWENFKFDQWCSMLKSNLDKGNPVIYDGYGTGGHHAFVLDGYSGEDYHVNWGWNGMANGYYALMDLTPFENENFSEHQGMVINIEPDPEMGDYSECFVDFGYLWAMGANRMAAEMNVSVENIEKGKPFHLFNSGITVTAGFEGQVGVAIVDKDNNIKEVLRTQHVSSYQPWTSSYDHTNTSIKFYDLVATCDIEPTDRLQLVSKQDRDQHYKIILGTLEWTSSRPVLNNSPETATVTFNIGEGTHCGYFKEGLESDIIPVPSGESTVDAYIGEFYLLQFGKEDPECTDPLHLTLKGRFFGGDTEYWSGHQPPRYPFGIWGPDNSVSLCLLHLVGEEIHLDEAGTLKDKLTSVDTFNLGELTITGKMNATDFWFLRDNCNNLTSLNLSGATIEEYTGGDGDWVPDNMTHAANTIPYRALPGLGSLEKLILPRNLTAIDAFSLMGLNLLSISVPEGVTTIGRDAFYANYNLEAIEILNPDVIELEVSPFDDTKCPANGVLFVPEGAGDAYSQADIWKDFGRIIEAQMPDPLKPEITLDCINYKCYIDEAQITGFEGEPGNVVIPETIKVGNNNYSVTSIKEDAFNNCQSLEKVSMPNSINTVGYNAFFSCSNLKEINFSQNVTEIKYYTFAYCTALEEFTFGPRLNKLGSGAFVGAGLKKIFIPKTLRASNGEYAFGYNASLEEIKVEEGHEDFRTIDGLLYRNTDDGLTLEATPGTRTGELVLPDECENIVTGALAQLADVTSIIVNDGVRKIETNTIAHNHNMKYLSLPGSAVISADAIWNNLGLESVAFRGNTVDYANIISFSPLLQHVYVNGDNEILSLDGLFSDGYENLNIYSSTLNKSFQYSGQHTVFVPGGCAERFNDGETNNVAEMWEYKISRGQNLISIKPLYEDITISKVVINGREVTSENNMYSIDPEDTPANILRAEDGDAPETLDVKVEYSLHGRHSMSTHYTPAFNSTIPDTVITGVETVAADCLRNTDIYTLSGVLILKDANEDSLRKLNQGVYIVRKGNVSKKIFINR